MIDSRSISPNTPKISTGSSKEGAAMVGEKGKKIAKGKFVERLKLPRSS